MKRTIFLALALTVLVTVAPTAPVYADVAGNFSGASDHITKGGVTVVKNADGSATVTFGAGFSLDGAPDPRVGFGKDGEFIVASDLGELKSLTGAQTYIVPATINIDDFNELYIWCLEFSVPLGVADLS